MLEPVARRANGEDQCTGRFWEERFKCVGLLDDPAIITCTAYVDLNPIRAGIALTPEESEYTSVFDRIRQRQDNRPEHLAADNWLSPISHKERKTKTTHRISQTPWLEMNVEDYLELADWTGRQFREDKKGAIPENLAPILERLKIKQEGWLLAAKNFGRLFKRFAGSAEKVADRARQHGRKYHQGRDACEEIFG